jgi:predicted O-methyltransferase YrrM
MAAALTRLRRADDPGVEPLVRALSTTVRGRLTAEERAWIERIEARRSQLLQRDAPTGLPEFDPAAESSPNRGFTITVPRTTMGLASALMSLTPSWCLLLMRLVTEKRPRSALELGTGFGISASYQAAALELNQAGTLVTLEGSEAWAEAASEGFAALGLERVEARVGPIAETLVEEAQRRAPLDFVFIDAEHQEQATIDHFEAVLPSLAEGAIVVLDDADWAEVRAAHETIEGHERVSTSIVVGRLGFSVLAGKPPS